MAELVLEVYDKADPAGTPLGVLSQSFARSATVDDNGIGGGGFSIHPDDSQAAWCEQGNYVLAYRDAVTEPADAIAGFWLEENHDVVLSPQEGGGKATVWSGRGPIAFLEEAQVWHRPVSGGGGVVQRSEGQWRWKNAHPAAVLLRLVEEAKARGGLAEVTVDFSRTTDSDGDPFSEDEAERFVVPIGLDLLSVVQELRETGLYVRMDPGFILHAWDSYGTDLSGSITLAAGTNIREAAERRREASRARSHLLIEGENKRDELRYRVVGDPSIKATIGRRKEGFVRYNRTATKAVLERVGNRRLAKYLLRHDGPPTLGLIDVAGAIALVDFTPGDTVAVDIPGVFDTESLRVASISLAEITNGEYDPIVEFVIPSYDPATGESLEHGPGSRSPGKPPGGGGGGGEAGGHNPGECSRCKFPPTSTGPHPVDDFGDRTVPPPTRVDGDTIAAGSLTHWARLEEGKTHFGVPVPAFVGGPSAYVGSYLGSWYRAWTQRTANSGCGGLDNQFTGWKEIEQWYRVSVPVHPADMAGIEVDLSLGAAQGYAASGEPNAIFEVVASAIAPTDMRQGAVVGTIVASGSATVFIPAEHVATAGSFQYIGLRPKWQAVYENWSCGWVWPYQSPEWIEDNEGNPWSGYSGRGGVGAGFSNAVWQTWSGGDAGIGATADPAETGAPWEGPTTYADAGEEGSPTVSVTDGALRISSTAPAGKGFYLPGPGEDEDNPHGPWSDFRGSRHDFTFDVDAAGDTGQAGTRSFEVTVSGAGRRAVATVHLGDQSHAAGISVAGPASSEYLAKAVDAATVYVLALDTRAGKARAKFWPAIEPEPALWDVEVPLTETLDVLDRLELWGRVGNVTGSQELAVRKIVGYRAAAPGQEVVAELVGVAGGTARRFPTAHAYERGTVRAYVVGAGLAPRREFPDDAEFGLGLDPTAGSWLRVRYIASDLEVP